MSTLNRLSAKIAHYSVISARQSVEMLCGPREWAKVILSALHKRGEWPSSVAHGGHVCDIFSDEECYNFFKAAGYETN